MARTVTQVVEVVLCSNRNFRKTLFTIQMEKKKIKRLLENKVNELLDNIKEFIIIFGGRGLSFITLLSYIPRHGTFLERTIISL